MIPTGGFARLRQKRNPFRFKIDSTGRRKRVIGLLSNFLGNTSTYFALEQHVREVENNYLQAMGEMMSVRNKSAARDSLERNYTRFALAIASTIRMVLSTHWICASVVMMFTSSISSSCLGDFKIVHQGAARPNEPSYYNFVVRRRGTLFIECDSWGCNIEVYRTGQSLCVADYFPRGTSKIVTVVFLDPNHLTTNIVFRGGTASDTYENNTDLPEEVFGNGGNDCLRCGYGSTYVSGGQGDDTIYLRTLSNTGSYNQAFGDEGGDSIYGSEFSDYIFGGANGDYLEGGGGNDYLLGGPGGDILFGNAGDDRLGGGFDGVADLLSGGEGSDEYSLYAYPGTNVNLDGSFYDIEIEVIIDDGTDRRRIIRQSSSTRSMEEPFLVDQDFGNAAFVQWVVDSYDLEYLTDPSLSIYAYDLEPIMAESADDPQFLLPPPVFVNPTTTTTTINTNSITRIRGW